MRTDRNTDILCGALPAEQQILRLDRQLATVVRLALLRFRREDLQRFNARRHRERVARERSRLIDGSCRRYPIHDLTPPTVSGDGKSATDDLAEAGEIGANAVGRLCSAERCAEAAHNLVKDEE